MEQQTHPVTKGGAAIPNAATQERLVRDVSLELLVRIYAH